MREVVVTLHGLWMTGLEMTLLRRRLRACGYIVHPFAYRSLLRSPADNARRLARFVDGLDADVVHFVAHSLGGLVLLHLFEQAPLQRPGRAVMLGTPVLGSAAARHAVNNPLLRPVALGRSVQRGLLGGAPAWHGARELGMVAGTRGGMGMGRVFGAPLPPPHDGTVCVQETRAAWITAHLSVPYGHFGLLYAPPVAEAVCRFLRTGAFDGRE
ncbi:esterase/lipase family protein [Acidihalobacter ferrooxydans]|uniref:Acetyltransferase/hydrolase n=1 Tax=Acidihalobacter ferrooxydans TaxID=1765967 RepID=A0A1P8UHR4_9GAMM|nr:alpha/beta fold hydrolase [Acidihalobacter ferrooxydans]APZ43388.1 acetyltransferase/hydrolase [Acidihalobacter ferrooxydans]